MTDDEDRCSDTEDVGREAAAARAALVFEDLVLMIADKDKVVTPLVVMHVTGLLGAFLATYSPYELDDVFAEIKRVTASEQVLGDMYEQLRAAGILAPEAAHKA